MSENNLVIVRGSTPLLVVTIPDDIQITDINDGLITISQRKFDVQITRLLSDMTLDAENKTYSSFLTQAETLLLHSNRTASIQVKLCDSADIVLVSYMYQIDVLPVNNERIVSTDHPEGQPYEVPFDNGVSFLPNMLNFKPKIDLADVITTGDYRLLSHKPSIGGVTLIDDVSLSDLSLYSKDEVDGIIENAMYAVDVRDDAQDTRMDGIDTRLDNQVGNFVLNRTVLADEYTNGQIDDALAGKVDKVTGKGLSTKDYTAEDQSKLSGLPTGEELTNALAGKKNTQTPVTSPTASGNALAFIDSVSQDAQGVITPTKKSVTVDSTPTAGSTNPVQSGGVATELGNLNQAISNKVDKVAGKGLSTEDYTTADKTKLTALPDAATLNADLANKQDASTAVRSVNGNLPTNGAVEVTAEDIPADGIGDKSVSGNPITIEDGMASVAKGLSVTLEPIQDLHGYESPWIGTDTDKAPYLFRAVADSSVADKGTHELDKLIGGTVAWNQLNDSPTTDFTVQDVSFTYTNGMWKANGTSTGTEGTGNCTLQFSAPNTHKFIIGILGNTKLKSYEYINYSLSSRKPGLYIINGGSQNNFRVRVAVEEGVTYNNEIFSCVAFDITQMFGSTIADYIYSLEQATAGAGVAWFKKLFPNDYYAYNAGELISVKTSAHVMRDANNNIIGNYALDADLELRGIPKLDSNNKLYYDGDVYEASGNVQRKYGVVDLGTLEWMYHSGSGNMYVDNAISDRKFDGCNAICAKYERFYSQDGGDATSAGNVTKDKSFAFQYTEIVIGRIIVRDTSYTDAASFKTAMSGVYLVYELATPTTETADPYTSSQVIDPDGTEEYVDSRTVAIPVGHESNYANICPIEGRTEVNVERTGKNLFPFMLEGCKTATGGTWTGNTTIRNGITYEVQTNGQGAITGVLCKGTATANSDLTLASQDFTEYAGMIMSGCPSGGVNGTTYRFVLQGHRSPWVIFAADIGDGATISLGEGIDFADGYIRIYSGYECPSEGILFKPMIRLASIQDGTFEPYSKDTASVSFGQTVYGCTHDFVSGKCRVTKGIVVLDGSENWSQPGVQGCYTAMNSVRKLSNYLSAIKCDKLETVENHGSLVNVDYGISGYYDAQSQYANENWIYAKAAGISTAADFKTWLASNPLQVCYELATPIELTLTPAQLSLLQGTNILTADGTINLTYLGSMTSNVQDEIDEFENGLNNVIGSIAFIENSTAKTSHTVGDYVILNGIFCKVIAGISAGETLSFGTNIQATTIGAELRAIWEEISA